MRRVIILDVTELSQWFHRAAIPIVYNHTPSVIYQKGAAYVFTSWLAYQLNNTLNIPLSGPAFRAVDFMRHDAVMHRIVRANYQLESLLYQRMQPAMEALQPAGSFSLEHLEVASPDLFLYFEGNTQ